MDQFGVSTNPTLLNKFPVERFFLELDEDLAILASTKHLSGDAVEFHMLSAFDRFQRLHLDNMYRTHPAMRPLRQSVKTTSIMPPTTPQMQIVLEKGTGLTDKSTVASLRVNSVLIRVFALGYCLIVLPRILVQTSLIAHG